MKTCQECPCDERGFLQKMMSPNWISWRNVPVQPNFFLRKVTWVQLNISPELKAVLKSPSGFKEMLFAWHLGERLLLSLSRLSWCADIHSNINVYLSSSRKTRSPLASHTVSPVFRHTIIKITKRQPIKTELVKNRKWNCKNFFFSLFFFNWN